MKKYLLELGSSDGTEFNAGSKARNDIVDILNKDEFKTIYLDLGNNKLEKFKNIINIEKRFSEIKKDDLVLLQFPFAGYYVAKLVLQKLRKIKCNLICLIHDIDSLRFYSYKNKKKKDIDILNMFDYVICHNVFMENWLLSNGLKSKTLCLELFDYLIEKDSFKIKENNKDNVIVFAGNLSKAKSGFIYNLNPSILGNIKLNLYGANLEEINIDNTISYLGKYKPDELPSVMSGDYGLIWDGNSTESCLGESGEYTRFNNPHKLSLYIATGLPVIVWSESAISKFVKENDIGLVVENLNDISQEVIKNKKNYNDFKKNTLRIRKNVLEGYYIKKAIKLIESNN